MSIWRRDSKCCATCVYWSGDRRFDSLPSVIVDGVSYGGCTNIRCPACVNRRSKMASEMNCSHYELHPSLR